MYATLLPTVYDALQCGLKISLSAHAFLFLLKPSVCVCMCDKLGKKYLRRLSSLQFSSISIFLSPWLNSIFKSTLIKDSQSFYSHSNDAAILVPENKERNADSYATHLGKK